MRFVKDVADMNRPYVIGQELMEYTWSVLLKKKCTEYFKQFGQQADELCTVIYEMKLATVSSEVS